MVISAASRAQDAWRRIGRNPTTVTMTKPRSTSGGVNTAAAALPAQVVRVETDSRATATPGVAGVSPQRQAVVFGIRDHPTLPDTVMAEGFIFTQDGDSYRCIDVLLVPGEVQGIFLVNG